MTQAWLKGKLKGYVVYLSRSGFRQFEVKPITEEELRSLVREHKEGRRVPR